jgi:hypothetical protein
VFRAPNSPPSYAVHRGRGGRRAPTAPFNSVYDPKLQLADHAQPVRYEISLPPAPQAAVAPEALYVHPGRGRRAREIDAQTERFVDETRMGTAT